MALTFLMLGDDALITRARRELVARFMAVPDATHLLFIDADIGFEPDQVFRLIDFGAEVAAAVYPLKKIQWDRVRELAAAGTKRLESAALSYVFQLKTPPVIRDNFVQANYAGTGFLLVRRQAWDAMARHYPELNCGSEGFHYGFFECLVEGEKGGFLPEDYSFCRRWTGMGGEIWADLRSRLDHVGSTLYVGDLSLHPSVTSTSIVSTGGAE